MKKVNLIFVFLFLSFFFSEYIIFLVYSKRKASRTSQRMAHSSSITSSQSCAHWQWICYPVFLLAGTDFPTLHGHYPSWSPWLCAAPQALWPLCCVHLIPSKGHGLLTKLHQVDYSNEVLVQDIQNIWQHQ